MFELFMDVLIIAAELLCACNLCVPVCARACLFDCLCWYLRVLVFSYVHLYLCVAMHACVNNFM